MKLSISAQQKLKLLNADDVYAVMQKVLLREQKIDQDKEHFWMIGLASNHRLLYIELVSMGSVNAVTVEPMNVYRMAVQKGAVKVIFVHNHPSGELKASEADKDLTDRLIQVGRILNIEAIDHLIISKKSYLSFADTNLFAQLQQSTKWVPQFEIIKRIKAEEKTIRDQAVKEAETKAELKLKQAETKRLNQLKEAEKKLKAVMDAGEKALTKRNLEVARQLKKRKLPMDEIMAISGLSRAEILRVK
jgi:DNA repair protein RadC